MASREARLAVAAAVSEEFFGQAGNGAPRGQANSGAAQPNQAEIDKQRKAEYLLKGRVETGADERVGSGAFAHVKLWTAENGEQVVVKSYEGSELEQNPLALQHMRSELALAGKLVHPNIIAPRSVCRRGNRVDVEMEYASGGSLADLVKRAKYNAVALREGDARRLFKQLVEGVAYLHGAGVAHGDIKPGNVMLDARGVARLIDFGTASEVNGLTDKVAAGTLAYMSPEAISGGKHDPKAGDVWALAVVLCNLLDHGGFPFEGKDEEALRHHICTAAPRLPAAADASCRALLGAMLNRTAAQRAPIDSVRAHPWLGQGGGANAAVIAAAAAGGRAPGGRPF